MEVGFLLGTPVRVQEGMVVFGVVGDDDHPPARRAAAPLQLLEEFPARLAWPLAELVQDDPSVHVRGWLTAGQLGARQNKC